MTPLRLPLLAALVLWPVFATAQESADVRAARQHFLGSVPAGQAGLRVASTDLDDLHPVAVHRDARTGLTVVTFVQRHEGVEVFGTTATAAVRRDGAVAAPAPRFETDLAGRAGPSTPSVGAAAAVQTAEARARATAERLAAAPADAIPVLTDDPVLDRQRAAAAAPAVEAAEPRLGYHETAGGALRLAWEVVVRSTAGPNVLRTVRVDAETGAVLADQDLLAHDTWPQASAAASPRQGAPALRSPVFVAGAAGRDARAPSYRVVAAPFESPSVGEFTLVTDPADPVASPFGWHSDGTTSFTITRGNNVYAYADSNSDNLADAGSAPDGGSALLFDFPFDPAASPAANADAALTNLFYWNNVVHDVLYRYGFDEAAGNFQVTNATGSGRPRDPVNAEGLDGSGTNNANFATPPDGQSPRMQMYRWTGASLFTVTSPSALAGPYPSAGASFGPGTGFAGPLAKATGPNGETTACTADAIADDLTGRVALIERGDCLFVEKVAAAEAKGAIAAVIYNRPAVAGDPTDNGGEALISMGGDDPGIGIPSVFVQNSTGLALRASAAPVAVALELVADRDSGLDAGVVTHEYGHGVSNRLIGGPGIVSCLTNGYTDSTEPANNRPGEQMGEGWSDFYGLLLTQRLGDTGRQPRGVGTYLRFENPDGRGIRNAPYSTDFAINDYTYQDVIARATHAPATTRDLSIPHGVGFAWATMLWEMTWELIDAFGYSEDVANADGTAGNQIALNLVTTGLKLTPCTPGFVDGRDAILAADAALYGGAYADYIWAAFARRGLGVEASQGAATNPNDGRASFATPGTLGAVALSATEVDAALAPGQTRVIQVELTSERETPQPFAVDTAALPAWVSVSPATGTVPASGSVALDVTVRPSPLDVGQLAASVPVVVGESTRLLLSVQVDTDAAVEGTHTLSPVGPNPSSTSARFTLAVAEGQTVRVDVVDRLGRRVQASAVRLEPDARQSFTVDVSGLASGLYVLRVTGDTFAESRVLTVVR